MINKSNLNNILKEYKADFISKIWPKEKYKWEAIKCFQDNWDINADNFTEMLIKSLSKTENLLTSKMYYPGKMMQEFSQQSPEEVRAMFINLFDESKNIINRIDDFKIQSTALLESLYNDGKKRIHYQAENAITTYLWLRFPDKYYIYKYTVARTVSNELNSSYKIKKGAFSDNIRNSFLLYNEICIELNNDEELLQLLKSQLSENCYVDSKLRTLAIDIGFYIYNTYSKKTVEITDEWKPKNYSPNISVDEWTNLLNDNEVFTESSLKIMKRLKDYGGFATCTQLSIKYGQTANFYNSGSSALAKRIANKTNCPKYNVEGNDFKWWPILYVGKAANKEESGIFIWKFRDNLSIALDKFDLSGVELYEKKSSDETKMGYWWLNANPKIWNFSDIKIGGIQTYTLYNDNGNKRRIYQNFLEVRAGDLIIGYESTPVKQVVAIAKITAEQDGDQITFEKLEGLIYPIDYKTLKEYAELKEMQFFTNSHGSLFKLTKDEYNFILDIIREENPITTKKKVESYSKEKLLDEVYMNENNYDMLTSVLKNKKNIILQGPPGVGKTFAAKRLAYSIINEKNDNQVEFVQFHQNYSYEDFMMGYKPTDTGFKLENGVFYKFCKKAENNPNKDFFFIIDEINRGNLSKIFGELLMLIEKGYRETKIALAYSNIPFSVPENLYIIGMMNTADRSLAMIDYALRRRFSFFELEPGYDTEGFLKYQNTLENKTFNKLINLIKELNTNIINDKSLGKGFCIGHSYFCEQENCSDEWLQAVIKFDILPMLSEYWFDDSNKFQIWENKLLGLFQ